MEIRKQIETLISLQVTSSAISRLSERLQSVENRIKTLDARLGTHVNELQLLESETEELQKNISSIGSGHTDEQFTFGQKSGKAELGQNQ